MEERKEGGGVSRPKYHFKRKYLTQNNRTHQDALEREVWWRTPIIPAPRRIRQENLTFKAILEYTAQLLKKNKES